MKIEERRGRREGGKRVVAVFRRSRNMKSFVFSCSIIHNKVTEKMKKKNWKLVVQCTFNEPWQQYTKNAASNNNFPKKKPRKQSHNFLQTIKCVEQCGGWKFFNKDCCIRMPWQEPSVHRNEIYCLLLPLRHKHKEHHHCKNLRGN